MKEDNQQQYEELIEVEDSSLTLANIESIANRDSIRICQVSPDIQNISELIIAADEALYEAKAKGKNRIVVSRNTNR